MLERTHSNQSRVGLSSSGALSHVYISYPPLRCNITGIQGLKYDEGNKLLLASTSDQVLAWQVGPSVMDPPTSDSIGEGPVLFIRFSLDMKLIAIQRSNHEIQFKNRETGETFSWRCKSDSERVLGFFWTDCPSCDIIVIKTSGLDLLSYESQANTLRLVEAKRFNVTWYVYTHESRMVLLASGMQCNIFLGFQFSSGGIIRLPKFEMSMAKAESNAKPVLSAEDIHLVTIYGRIYCLQLDKVGMVLNLYRFYRDAVVQQGTLAIYSSKIAVSVIDNVLLVHQVDAKVVILYDMFLDSLSPISAPLPLLLRSSSIDSRQTIQLDDNLPSAYGATVYSDSWTFLVPDLILDSAHGLLWRICLDLEAISASSSDVPSLLEFLQRRRSDASKIKMLCLAITRSVILERRPISIVSRVIDVILASYSHSLKLDNALQTEGRSSATAKQSINQTTTTSKVVLEDSLNRIRDGENSSQVYDESQQSIIRDSTGDTRQSAARNISGEPIGSSSSNDLLVSDIMDDSRTGINPQTPNIGLEQSEGPENNNIGTYSFASNQQDSQFTSVAISPNEMYNFVFALVEEELGGDPVYMVAIILEFLHSVTREKLKVHPNLYAMIIQVLVRTNRISELAFFVSSKILEPSKEVALQLLESGRQDIQVRKLGTDMLRQLYLHHDVVAALLQDGYYLEALRYARKHKVITVRPALFLESAVAAHNAQHLAAVLRFFSEFTPSFKNTSDYNRYCQIVTEMSQ